MSLLLLKQDGFVRAGLVAHYDFFKQNLLADSERFDDAAWNPTSVNVTPNSANAPDGSVTADLLAPTNTNSFIRQSVSVQQSRDYTFSIYLKSSGEDRELRISIHDAGLSLIAGQVITATSVWQRFEVTANSGTNTTIQVLIGGGSTWSTGEDVYAWGAQVNEGTSPLTYEKTTDNQLLPDLSGRGNGLTLGSSIALGEDDPTWAQHRLIFDGGDVAQRSATVGLPSGNDSLTLVTVAKMSNLATDQVLLSFGSGLNGGTPNIQVDTLDHLKVGFSGTGWTTEIGTPIGSQSSFFMGTMRYESDSRALNAVLNEFAQSSSATLASDPATTNEQLAVGSTFGGANPASAEVVYALVYNRRLNDGEVRRVYRAVKRVLLSRGMGLP